MKIKVEKSAISVTAPDLSLVVSYWYLHDLNRVGDMRYAPDVITRWGRIPLPWWHNDRAALRKALDNAESMVVLTGCSMYMTHYMPHQRKNGRAAAWVRVVAIARLVGPVSTQKNRLGSLINKLVREPRQVNKIYRTN